MNNSKRCIKVLVKRGYIDNIILDDGEIGYSYSTKCFYIGDGSSLTKELFPYNGLVKSPNGKMFFTYVDDNGNCYCRQIETQIQGKTFQFYTDENKMIWTTTVKKQHYNLTNPINIKDWKLPSLTPLIPLQFDDTNRYKFKHRY